MQVIPDKALSLQELEKGGAFTSEAGTTLTVSNKYVLIATCCVTPG
jgi:hypothetical protein